MAGRAQARKALMSPAAVALACELIRSRSCWRPKWCACMNSEDGHHTVTLRVPVNLVGGVMGQRGERIMHIEKLCGAKVDLSKRFENDMREIRVSSGDAGAVERAVEMIQAAVHRELHGGRQVQSQPVEKQRAAGARRRPPAPDSAKRPCSMTWP